MKGSEPSAEPGSAAWKTTPNPASRPAVGCAAPVRNAAALPASRSAPEHHRTDQCAECEVCRSSPSLIARRAAHVGCPTMQVPTLTEQDNLAGGLVE